MNRRNGLNWCQVFGVVALVCFAPKGSSQDRFVSKDSIPYGIHDVGGCKIITPRSTDRPGGRFEEWCRAQPVPENRFGKSWHDYYSPIELSLGDALDLAEQLVGGYTHSLLRVNTQLVFHNEPYANAMIYVSDSEIVFFINDGLVDLIEGTARGLAMKTLPLQYEVFRDVLGVNFDEWLEGMRTPRRLWGNRPIVVGPDPIAAPGFEAAWLFGTRIEVLMLYGFIFAHELAHLKARDKVEEPDVVLELRRDLEALRSMATAKVRGYADMAAGYVSALMLAMWYHEKYWEKEILEAGYLSFRGATALMHVRDWKKRGQAILEELNPTNRSVSTPSTRAQHAWLSRLYSLRDPLPEHASTTELSTGLIAEWLDDSSNMDVDSSAPYRYRIVNKNTVPVRVVVEVQSRAYWRDNNVPVSKMAPYDREERRLYGVVDDSVHELTLDADAGRTIAGELVVVSNDQIYGRVKLRIVSAFRTAELPHYDR